MTNAINVGIKLLSTQCKPVRLHEDDSCYDLHSQVDTYIPAGEIRKVPLGICLEIPVGWEGQIRPRSGLSSKGIWVAFGTIDSGYRGELLACVLNTTREGFAVETGMRIAQLTFARVPVVYWRSVNEMSETERGANGFGSTGLNNGTDS